MINKTFVGILMGSDSDLPIMQDAAKVLEELGIGCEVHTLSAHRTPEAVVEYVKKGESVVTKCSSAAPEAPRLSLQESSRRIPRFLLLVFLL